MFALERFHVGIVSLCVFLVICKESPFSKYAPRLGGHTSLLEVRLTDRFTWSGCQAHVSM